MNKVKWMAFAFPKSYFLSLGLFLPGKFSFRQQQFEPIPDSDYQEVLSITWGGAEGRLSIVFMPKQNRTGFIITKMNLIIGFIIFMLLIDSEWL